MERFVAGSLAGVIAQSTIYPMEVIITLITHALQIKEALRDLIHDLKRCTEMKHFSSLNLSPGPENSSCSEEDRAVLWYLRLCQADFQEGRTWSIL